MSPLTSYVRQEAKSRDRACGEPHFHLQVSTRKAGPRALDVPMIRPETGRDDGEGLPARAFLIETPARGAPLCLPASPPQVGRLSPPPSRLYLKR
mgnify:FL=1